MEGDPATLKLVADGPGRRPLDFRCSTRRTNQRLLVSVCRDQDERLGRTVLFDAPTSHGLPFRRGFLARFRPAQPIMQFMT